MPRYGMRTAARTGTLAHQAVGLCLFAGLAVFVAGCGGGAIAPVQTLSGPAVPGSGREHVVGRGETVYAIAWRHGVDYRALAQVNSIRDPYTIYPGQRLLIPEPGDVVPLAPEPGPSPSEPAAPGDVSTHGIDTPEAPVIRPMLPPTPEPPVKPLRKAVEEPPPVPEPPPPPVPEPASTPAAEPPLAARKVAGLSWTRPTRGKVIKGFGSGGNKGLDIGGAFEQSIRAAARGRVVYAGSGLIGYGKLVIVKHNNRLLSAYAHNERLHVGEGDAVKGGQHIADMGRSGKGHAMLHFEIRRDGKPVDPLRFLP